MERAEREKEHQKMMTELEQENKSFKRWIYGSLVFLIIGMVSLDIVNWYVIQSMIKGVG